MNDPRLKTRASEDSWKWVRSGSSQLEGFPLEQAQGEGFVVVHSSSASARELGFSS